MPDSEFRPNTVVLQADDGWDATLLGEQMAKRANTLAALLERELRMQAVRSPAPAASAASGGLTLFVDGPRSPAHFHDPHLPASSTRASSPRFSLQRILAEGYRAAIRAGPACRRHRQWRSSRGPRPSR